MAHSGDRNKTEISASLDALTSECETRDLEIARLTEQLELVCSSRSWRVTQPLRLVARLIRYPEPTLRDIARRFWPDAQGETRDGRGTARIEVGQNEPLVNGDRRENGGLIADVSRRFAVTPAFVEDYFSYQKIDYRLYSDWEDLIASLDSVNRMYVEFALTTTVRGRRVAEVVKPYLSPKNKSAAQSRYLDVGCGYGGFLRAFAEDGYEVTGLELLPHLADFSRRNTEDLPDARIVEADFLTHPLDSLGDFDCVTCNDVIEHVEDAALALDRLASLVSREGLLFMEIPNKNCIDFVASDGHFQVFAINCLRRHDAAKYYEELTGISNYLSHMGEFYSLDYYVDALSAKDLRVELVPRLQNSDLEGVPQKIVALEQTHQDWLLTQAPRLTVTMIEMVEDAFEHYRRQLYRDLQSARSQGDDATFLYRYLTSFWTLVARRR